MIRSAFVGELIDKCICHGEPPPLLRDCADFIVDGHRSAQIAGERSAGITDPRFHMIICVSEVDGNGATRRIVVCIAAAVGNDLADGRGEINAPRAVGGGRRQIVESVPEATEGGMKFSSAIWSGRDLGMLKVPIRNAAGLRRGQLQPPPR